MLISCSTKGKRWHSQKAMLEMYRKKKSSNTTEEHHLPYKMDKQRGPSFTQEETEGLIEVSDNTWADNPIQELWSTRW